MKRRPAAFRWRPGALVLVAFAVLTTILVAACGTAPAVPTVTSGTTPDSPQMLQAELDGLSPGNAKVGKGRFSAAGCVACHSLEPDVRIVGPSLAGVATRAASRKPGYSAELYLYESITRPGVYVVAGFPNGLMPPDFRTRLRPQDLADVIAFLMTEK